MNTPDKVINIALSQVGYLEKSKAAYLSDPSVLYKFTEGAGSDNYTKFNKEMHDIYPEVMDFPCYWCASFVEFCFYHAYGMSTLKSMKGTMDDYTVAEASAYKKKNAYYKTPKVGDQIFFNNGTRICHTGLVYKVDDRNVYTVEGNTSGGNTVIANGGSVAKKSYPLNYERIDGYGRPKYDAEVQDGWVFTDGKWDYYRDGNKVTREWIDYNNKRYRVGVDGAMLTEWHQIYDDEGILRWYYFDKDGAMWHETDKRDGSLEVFIKED